MPSRTLTAQSLRAGTEDLGQSTLSLRRDDPEPGVPGTMSWRFRGQAQMPPEPLPHHVQLTATLADGREVTGRGFLSWHEIETRRGLMVSYTYEGTGTLDGLTDEDYG